MSIAYSDMYNTNHYMFLPKEVLTFICKMDLSTACSMKHLSPYFEVIFKEMELSFLRTLNEDSLKNAIYANDFKRVRNILKFSSCLHNKYPLSRSYLNYDSYLYYACNAFYLSRRRKEIIKLLLQQEKQTQACYIYTEKMCRSRNFIDIADLIIPYITVD